MRLLLLLLFSAPLFAEVAYPWRPPPEHPAEDVHDSHRRYQALSEEPGDYWDRQSDHTDARLRDAESGRHRGFADRVREQRLLRQQSNAYQRRRAREPQTGTARQRQANRMVERSWHTLPSQGVSSAKKRQYMWPYKQGSYPPNNYDNGR